MRARLMVLLLTALLGAGCSCGGERPPSATGILSSSTTAKAASGFDPDFPSLEAQAKPPYAAGTQVGVDYE